MEVSMECTTDPTNPRTGVFWNFNDYPIIEILDPLLVKQQIEIAVSDAGYNSRDLSIHLWGYVDHNTEKMDQIYSTNHIPITFRRMGDKLELVNSMIVNILLWSLDNPAPANIMVLSKYIGNKMQETLESLHLKEDNILLTNLPDLSDYIRCKSLGWLLKVLSPPPVPKIKRKKMPQSADSSDLVTLFGSNSVENVFTKWDDFPDASRYARDAAVFWDFEDSSILTKVDPLLTCGKITAALREKSYTGEVRIYAFVEVDSLGDEVFESFLDVGISLEQTPKGAQTSRSCDLAQLILLLALNKFDECVLLLSKNNDFQTVVNALKEHEFHVALVDPGEFLIMKSDSSQALE